MKPEVLNQVKETIDKICEKFEVTEYTKEKIDEIISKLQANTKIKFRGYTVNQIAGAVIYLAVSLTGEHLTLRQIAKALSVTTSTIITLKKRLIQELELDKDATTLEDVIRVNASLLLANGKDVEEIIRIANEVKDTPEFVNMDKRDVAISCIAYYFKTKHKLPTKLLSEVLRVSEPTLRERIKIVSSYVNGVKEIAER